jgi:hypothetical protein
MAFVPAGPWMHLILFYFILFVCPGRSLYAHSGKHAEKPWWAALTVL